LRQLMTPALHAASGFPLGKPHHQAQCEDCHLDSERKYAERFPGRDSAGCSLCHDDPHAGQFNEGLFAQQECTACHREDRFDPPQFDVDAHGKTAFPLEGAHLTAACSACHLDPPQASARVFHGTRSKCENCHEDAHVGFFDATLSALALPRAQGVCSECHLASSFDDVLSIQDGAALDPEKTPRTGESTGAGRPFGHGQWTGFDLVGAHAQEACETCHPRSDKRDQTGRRFGRIEEHFGNYQNCATCHLDPHGEMFDQGEAPPAYKGQSGCQRCHSENSFRALPHGFDHELWTGFELDGAHAATSCESCHAARRVATERGRTWERAQGSNCGACHGEPHVGQFAREGVTDCSQCHRSAEGWAELRFDHNRHSRFPLGDSHRQVDCSSCHSEWKLESGLGIVRYRPLETSCSSCHGAERGPTLRRRGRRD